LSRHASGLATRRTLDCTPFRQMLELSAKPRPDNFAAPDLSAMVTAHANQRPDCPRRRQLINPGNASIAVARSPGAGEAATPNTCQKRSHRVIAIAMG
jgi:hypothetical protein